MHSLIDRTQSFRWEFFNGSPRAALSVEIIKKKPLTVKIKGIVVAKPQTSWVECKKIVVKLDEDEETFSNLWVSAETLDPFHLVIEPFNQRVEDW